MSAGCSSVLSGTSTAIDSYPFTHIRDSRSSEDEFLSTSDESEGEEVDVLALIDALDSGISVSFDRSQSSKESSSAALVSNDDGDSEECVDDESHRVVDRGSLVARGRAWAEKVAFGSDALPGSVNADCPIVISPLVSQSSSPTGDDGVFVDDVSEVSDGSARSFQAPLHLESHSNTQRGSQFASNSGSQARRPDEFQHQHQSSQPEPIHQRQENASASQYNLSSAFEHSRNRLAPSFQPPPPP